MPRCVGQNSRMNHRGGSRGRFLRLSDMGGSPSRLMADHDCDSLGRKRQPQLVVVPGAIGSGDGGGYSTVSDPYIPPS